MRPAPIPDAALWSGAVRRVISPPDGDLTNPTIAPVEVVIEVLPDGVPCISARCVLEPGDLEKLQAGGVVWVSFYTGAIPPFALTVADQDGIRP